MSTETIVHIYCDGTGCIEEISGYSITATEQFKKDDMKERGWTVIDGEQEDVAEFCGMPLVGKEDDCHFCPKCSTNIEQSDNPELAKAAKKAMNTGSRTDLHEYLKLRRNFI